MIADHTCNRTIDRATGRATGRLVVPPVVRHHVMTPGERTINRIRSVAICQIDRTISRRVPRLIVRSIAGCHDWSYAIGRRVPRLIICARSQDVAIDRIYDRSQDATIDRTIGRGAQ